MIGVPGATRRRGRARLLAVGVMTATLTVCLAAGGLAAQDETTLISLAKVVPGGKANAFSGSVSASADGRYVAFSTTATNLVAADTSADEDIYVRDRVAQTTTLITPGDGPVADQGGGAQPSISDDGQRVAFMSFEDLTANDTNNVSDIYVYDFATGQTTLVSRPTGTGSAPAGRSSGPAISGDGTSVAFASVSNTLDPAHDTDTSTSTFFAQDVFVRDLDTNTTELVSRDASADGDRSSQRPSIDADGSHVGFDTVATNLDSADTDATDDVYVRDRTAGTLTLVSRADGPGGAKANASAKGPSLSGDGNEVAFISDATNLDPADPAGEEAAHVSDVYLRDIATNETELVSRASGASGAGANKIAQGATISADGNLVAFISSADNLDPDKTTPGTQNQAYIRNRSAATTRLESRADGAAGAIANDDVAEASISANGMALALASRATNLDPADAESTQDAFVRDFAAADTVLVSQSPAAAPENANGESRDPAISADGRYVAFTSAATNIDPAATNNRTDVFVHDTTTGLTVLASREGTAGAEGDGASGNPSISADGRYVAFESEAENLAVGDGDGQPDIYVRDLVANSTALVSLHDTGDANAGGFPAEPSISADGTRVAFDVDVAYNAADSNGVGDVYVRDLTAGETLLVSRPDGVAGAGDAASQLAEISADGETVAFESRADNLTADPPSAVQQVFVRRLDLDDTTLVSRADSAGGAIADADAREPTVSGDGSVVAFESGAANLDPEKTSTTTQVFARDLDTLDTVVASRADGGAIANAASNSPDLADDGTYIAFESSATNLDAAATNARPDVFQRDLIAGTTTLASRVDGASGAEGNETSGDPSISEHGRFVAFESAASNLEPADTDPISDVYLRDVLGLDTAAPNTTITGGPATGSVNPTRSFTFTFVVNEPGAKSECRVDGGAFAPCSGSFNTGSLADGTHTFRVRSIDRVGNIEPSPAVRTFTVDTLAPETTLTDPPQGSISDPSPTIAFASSEPGSTFECALDGAAFSGCTSAITLGPLADGEHSLAVRAIDAAGNRDQTPAVGSFVVDTAISGRDVKADGKQDLSKGKVKVAVKVKAGEAATAALTGTITPGGEKLKPVTASAGDGDSLKLVGKLKKDGQNRQIERKLERGKKLKAKLEISVSDAAGNVEESTVKVKLSE